MKTFFCHCVLLVLSILSIPHYCLAQEVPKSSRNGYYLSPEGEFRIMVLYIDVLDNQYPPFFHNWPAGELPPFAMSLFHPDSTYSVSRYFNEVSFGEFNVIHDYFPTLLEMERSNYSDFYLYLHNLPGNDIEMANGNGLSFFDTREVPLSSTNTYQEKSISSNNKIDASMIIYRRCQVSGGGLTNYHIQKRIKDYRHIEIQFQIFSNDLTGTITHEIAHPLIGGNSYHTGGAGTESPGHFLSNIGGYGMLCSYNNNLNFCNGWDRWWLGWKNPDHTYYISARDADGSEVDADLTYGQNLASNEFILRDFATVGDAIRIKLPHLQEANSSVRNQYLWIENHQLLPNSIESADHRDLPKGIRFNIQIGNDRLDGDFDKSRANYLVPLSAFGNYDFRYAPSPDPTLDRYYAFTHESFSNPFTGNHPIMLPAIDRNENDAIQAKEFILIEKIYKNGLLALDNIPVFGNCYDAFQPSSGLSLASNPPSSPLMTHRTASRKIGDSYWDANPDPVIDDNRHIWLNGLRVDIVEQYADGSIKVRIVWDDFDVDNDVRWCGPVMLTEQLNLKSSRTITLDHGLTPTKASNPVVLDGEKVFADPTVFTCRDGSYLKQESHSTVRAIRHSTLVVESGALYEVGDGAVLEIGSTAGLLVRAGGKLRVLGRGHVEVRAGGHICLEPGAIVELVDPLSVVNLRQGYLCGIPDYSGSVPSATCTAAPALHPVVGQGRIADGFSTERCIQNTVYHNDAYETGSSIRAGHDICEPPHGDVVILPGVNVILDSEGSVLLRNGIEVHPGASLEVR